MAQPSGPSRGPQALMLKRCSSTKRITFAPDRRLLSRVFGRTRDRLQPTGDKLTLADAHRCAHPRFSLGGRAVPHRAPGSPGHGPKDYLKGKPIKYYRPRGSDGIRQLIDGGFQAFNAGRLSEACHIYHRQDAGAGERHDHRSDGRRRADAGRARRLRHRADGARPDRLRDQHRREPLSRPSLRAELHAAPRLAVPRRRGALRAGHHPDLRRALSGDRAARDRQVHPRLPGQVEAGRPDLHLRVPLSPRPRSARAESRLRGLLRRRVARPKPAFRSTRRRPATARSA